MRCILQSKSKECLLLSFFSLQFQLDADCKMLNESQADWYHLMSWMAGLFYY
jgi:hypothetical protein